jgi:hypothetical protein
LAFNKDNFVTVPTTKNIRVGLCSVKKIPAGLSPVKSVAVYQQVTNQKCDAYNDDLLKCASDIEDCHVLSMSFDGLAIKHDFIVRLLVSFMHGVKNTVGVVGPIHATKSLRSQPGLRS